MFVDTMLKGAFLSMKHLHKFENVNECTKMIDIFEFESPFGPIGHLVNFLFLENYMRRFLITRNEILKSTAERLAKYPLNNSPQIPTTRH